MTEWSERQTDLIEAELRGYEMAARQAREGRRIARPLDTGERVVFVVFVFLNFAAVALVASWVVP